MLSELVVALHEQLNSKAGRERKSKDTEVSSCRLSALDHQHLTWHWLRHSKTEGGTVPDDLGCDGMGWQWVAVDEGLFSLEMRGSWSW